MKKRSFLLLPTPVQSPSHTMDTLLTKLSPHRESHRVWIEDAYGRLSKNGFSPNTPFSVNIRKGGTGLIIQAQPNSGPITISKRANRPILSLERKSLQETLGLEFFRARITYKTVILLPRILCFYFNENREKTLAHLQGWKVTIGKEDSMDLRTNVPIRKSKKQITYLEACIDSENIVQACEFILYNTPQTVKLSGEEIPMATQWIQQIGYQLSPDQPTTFYRP